LLLCRFWTQCAVTCHEEGAERGYEPISYKLNSATWRPWRLWKTDEVPGCLAANPGKSAACRLFCSKEKASLLAPLQVLNPTCHPVLWHAVLPAAGSQKACHLTPMKPMENGRNACAAAEIA
jgi:hypothetical protein